MSPDSSQSLSTFTAADGSNIALRDWALADDAPPRGLVLLVHGLGEHAGRYDPVALALNRWGFAVRGYDQYGHGESDGVRGGLPTSTRLIDDLADVIESSRAQFGAPLPLVLFGHSLGGLIAAAAVASRDLAVSALVLSSPALDAGLNAVQKLLLLVVPHLSPDLRAGNGLDPDCISHDPAVVAAYRADPLVHDRISIRLARFIADQGPAVLARAPRWKVPTLLLYAGADKLVNPRGSRAFAAAAPAGIVTAHCFDGLFHEIFNEPEPQSGPVFETLRQWLDQRFPIGPVHATFARPAG